jgi:hypothetical protein
MANYTDLAAGLIEQIGAMLNDIEDPTPVLAQASAEVDRAALERYWLDNYATDHCTLCGNYGIIDTRDVRTPAGVTVGRLNYCICPNGTAMRAQGALLRPH